MASPETQKLAERIARILDAESTSSTETAALFAAIEKINNRLDKIENRQAKIAGKHDQSQDILARSQISGLKLDHPSLDKLSVAEAIADMIFAGEQKEKACQYEPAKPCDHCSMCSSRGF